MGKKTSQKKEGLGLLVPFELFWVDLFHFDSANRVDLTSLKPNKSRTLMKDTAALFELAIHQRILQCIHHMIKYRQY